MTLAEFKAWFEGFTEDMDGAPSKKQWERIKARVSEIDGVAVTRTVFVDHYIPAGRRYWWENPVVTWGSTTNIPLTTTGQSFNSHAAMLDLGKAEYQAAIAA